MVSALKLQSDAPLSNFAFSFNLRGYGMAEVMAGTAGNRDDAKLWWGQMLTLAASHYLPLCPQMLFCGLGGLLKTKHTHTHTHYAQGHSFQVGLLYMRWMTWRVPVHMWWMMWRAPVHYLVVDVASVSHMSLRVGRSWRSCTARPLRSRLGLTRHPLTVCS